MLGNREANEILAQVRYKAGYYLHWDWPFKDHAVIRVWWTFQRPDVNQPERETLGRSGDVLVDLQEATPEGLLRQVFGMTLRLEEHEAREWFHFEGLRMFDPHKSLLHEGARWSAERCVKCKDNRTHLFHDDGTVNEANPDADDVIQPGAWLNEVLA